MAGQSDRFAEKTHATADSEQKQRDRFIETAKALGADEDDGTLDRVLKQVAPPVAPKEEKRAKE